MVVNALKTSYQSELARAAGYVDPITANSLRREGQAKQPMYCFSGIPAAMSDEPACIPCSVW